MNDPQTFSKLSKHYKRCKHCKGEYIKGVPKIFLGLTPIVSHDIRNIKFNKMHKSEKLKEEDIDNESSHKKRKNDGASSSYKACL
jgi:hypothetical protein